jgi:hypothetical protein
VTGEQEIVCSSDQFQNPWGVLPLANGDKLLVDEQPRVILCHPDKTWETFVEGPPLVNADNLALDLDGSILVADHEVGIIRIDPATKQMTVACSGFSSAYGIAVEPTGDWLVADSHVALFRVTPESFPDCPRQKIFDHPAFSVAVASVGAAASTFTVRVRPTLRVAVQPTVRFKALAVGQSDSKPVPVTVTSNNEAGYQLSVIRTEFANGDIPLSLEPPTPPGTGVANVTAKKAIPPREAVKVGYRTAVSDPGGDVWPLTFDLGDVPDGAKPGLHPATVTFFVMAL